MRRIEWSRIDRRIDKALFSGEPLQCLIYDAESRNSDEGAAIKSCRRAESSRSRRCVLLTAEWATDKEHDMLKTSDNAFLLPRRPRIIGLC